MRQRQENKGKKRAYIFFIWNNYQGSIDKIKKSKNLLQPIYEAFTNSLESIKDKSEDCTSEEIIISLYQNSNLTSAQTNEYEYSKIKIMAYVTNVTVAHELLGY